MDTMSFTAPDDLRASVDSAMYLLPPGDLFLNPANQLLRDAWVAARFGMGYEKFVSPCAIAVNSSNNRKDADFFVRANGHTFAFQTAEVIEPERRRSDEYRIVQKEGIYSTLVDPEIGRLAGPEWIANAVRRKIAKNYANSMEIELLLYLNFTGRELEYEACCTSVEQFRNSFGSIWLVSDHFIGSLASRPEIGEVRGWGKFLVRA